MPVLSPGGEVAKHHSGAGDWSIIISRLFVELGHKYELLLGRDGAAFLFLGQPQKCIKTRKLIVIFDV